MRNKIPALFTHFLLQKCTPLSEYCPSPLSSPFVSLIYHRIIYNSFAQLSCRARCLAGGRRPSLLVPLLSQVALAECDVDHPRQTQHFQTQTQTPFCLPQCVMAAEDFFG